MSNRVINSQVAEPSSDQSYYSVILGGKEAENNVLHIGDIYATQVYRAHSFIIKNHLETPLDFLVCGLQQFTAFCY